ncbi:hypothetical protein JSY36_02865 [Bacillus sp. H-16]|uniref:hypothetical protein n=1 Tax=Alteribacter salitolerans TaxID=2912333 RepID=UPI0019654B02|nr:hypothetical protein [Alteribacter salitolerans]MBM7094688.1 hypothetical protein [Alteribacter salitolerans]
MGRKQLFLYLAGFLSGHYAILFFKNQPFYSIELLTASLVFSPFSWFFGAFSFVLGFLCFSSLIKAEHQGLFNLIGKRHAVLFLTALYFILMFKWPGVVFAGFALLYGIMDALDLRRKERDQS